MTITTYEGWKGKGSLTTARATWNVALWIDNDYGSYQARMYDKPRTAEECERFCRDIFASDWTPDDCKLNDVNWEEIAEHWADDYEVAS